ncbi:SIS domain-containing protein [Aeromonas enteropelogenes]|uniref:SIS domain-containing protein n=1 Tax=Aeromonas enteropelogenes TaxID=29489 RepID=UPI003BA0B50A
MMMQEIFFDCVTTSLKTIHESQRQTMLDVAQKLSEIVRNDGIVYVFGCGHSHIFAEDVFYRAGGLACVRPIFIEPLMLHEGAARSSYLEKQEGYITEQLSAYNISDRDAFIVISTSGINPAPVEAISWAKSHGALAVGITSYQYCDTQSSRHSSGQNLRDVADISIDNNVPIGDAVLNYGNCTPFTPISSINGIYIIQSLFSELVKSLSEADYLPPIFKSGNISGSSEHNVALLELYKDKVPELTLNNNK